MQHPNTPTTGVQNQDGKTIAIIAYLTIIGWVIAFVMHGNNKTTLGAYHLRQAILLMLLGFACWILSTVLFFIPLLGWILNLLLIPLSLGLFVLWIIGLINAINGQEKPVPIIGQKAQELFHGLN